MGNWIRALRAKWRKWAYEQAIRELQHEAQRGEEARLALERLGLPTATPPGRRR